MACPPETVSQPPQHDGQHRECLLTLKVPDGVVGITLHYPDDDIYVKLLRERRGDGHDHFLSEDGRVIPLEVPATIDVLKHLEEHQVFYMSGEKMQRAIVLAKKLYAERKARAERHVPQNGIAEQPAHKKSTAKDALRRLYGELPLAVLNRCADTIRKKL